MCPLWKAMKENHKSPSKKRHEIDKLACMRAFNILEGRRQVLDFVFVCVHKNKMVVGDHDLILCNLYIGQLGKFS